MIGKKRYGFFALLLAAIVALGSCGNNTGSHLGTDFTSEESSMQTVNWDTYQIAEPQKVEEGSLWYMSEYHDDWMSPPENHDWWYFAGTATPDGNICCILQCRTGNMDDNSHKVHYCLEYFDTQAGQSFLTPFEPDSWGMPEGAFLSGMDMADSNLASFLFCSFGETGSSLSCVTLVLFHLEKGVQKTLDLLPALTEAGLVQQTEVTGTQTNILCDPAGYCYLFWDDQLVVVDDAGELRCHIRQEGEPSPSCLCKTSTGFPVFTTDSKGDRSYWIFDHTAGEMRSLGITPDMKLQHSCMDAFGNLYYLSEGCIVKWDTLTGKQEQIYDCKESGICSNTYANKVMTVRENGDLIIMDPITENQNIYAFSPIPPEKTVTLTLVSTAHESRLEQRAAALFSMKNPGVNIEFTSVESSGAGNREESERYADNLINRVIAGNAPDMFIVSAENMHLLYDKGALADLTGMIPPTTREQVFNCVWNAGTIDGKLTGLTTSLSCSSILVSDAVWPEDTWTLEDILELAENAPEDTLKGLVPVYGFMPKASDVLYRLVLQNIDSSLMDREAGACHFDSEVFRKLLEYCKNTPIPESNPDARNAAPARAVIEGEYLAYACDLYRGILDFSREMSFFPEGYHWVGVPTRDVSGNLVQAEYFLVVSKDTENMDLIEEFLPTLYDDELERQFPNNCLRRDVLRERVIFSKWDSSLKYDLGEGSYMVLDGKPDGTSYVEDYITFLDNCVPRPPRDSIIADIVMEEAESYFAGDKNIDEVIQIIQSRVQLYLDENSF